jgi:hypothetical protein
VMQVCLEMTNGPKAVAPDGLFINGVVPEVFPPFPRPLGESQGKASVDKHLHVRYPLSLGDRIAAATEEGT